MAKKISLQQVAEELNDVMAYGCDKQGNLVKPEEQIDLELNDKALTEEILTRCKEDLLPGDKESFSPEAWAWFEAHDLPNMGEEDVPDGEAEEAEVVDETEEAEVVEEEPEPEPAPAPKKQAAGNKADKPKPNTPKNAEKGGSQPSKAKTQANTQAEGKKAEKAKSAPSGGSQEKRPKNDGNIEEKKRRASTTNMRQLAPAGNENYAKELVEAKTSFDDFRAKFATLYHQANVTDESYITKRAKVYWNIAHKALGLENPLKGNRGAKSTREKNKPADDAE